MNFNTNFLMKRYNKSYHANQIEILLTGLFYDNSTLNYGFMKVIIYPYITYLNEESHSKRYKYAFPA